MAGPVVNTPAFVAAASASYPQALLLKLISSGCLAARFSLPAVLATVDYLAPDEAPKVSSDTVSLLVGQDRGSILRVANLLIQLDRQKELGLQRDLQAKQMHQAGLTVPKDFCPLPFFFGQTI